MGRGVVSDEDTTVADDPDAPRELPTGCVTPSSLRSLANAVDRLGSWHADMGGPASGMPCVRRVIAKRDGVHAEVEADGKRYLLALEAGRDWVLIPEQTYGLTK